MHVMISATVRSDFRQLLHQRDGAVCPARRHVNVVRLDDELGVGIAFLSGYNFVELSVVVSGLEALVAFFFRWITAHVNERVCRADTQLRIALEWNPVTYVCNSVPCIDRCSAAGEACGERIPLSGLRRVNA